jgi:hypothetical protein
VVGSIVGSRVSPEVPEVPGFVGESVVPTPVSVAVGAKVGAGEVVG